MLQVCPSEGLLRGNPIGGQDVAVLIAGELDDLNPPAVGESANDQVGEADRHAGTPRQRALRTGIAVCDGFEQPSGMCVVVRQWNTLRACHLQAEVIGAETKWRGVHGMNAR